MSRAGVEHRDSPRFVALAHALLDEGRAVRFRASGWSMHPAIRNGEAITVAPIEAAAIRRGDVLLYRCGRGVTAHRVVSIATSGGARRLLLRGDATDAPDTPIAGDKVLGRVIAIERDGRTIKLSRSWRAARALATLHSAVRAAARTAARSSTR